MCPKAPELLNLQKKMAPFQAEDWQEIQQMIEDGDLDNAERALKEALFIDPEDFQLLNIHRRWRKAKGHLP